MERTPLGVLRQWAVPKSSQKVSFPLHWLRFHLIDDGLVESAFQLIFVGLLRYLEVGARGGI